MIHSSSIDRIFREARIEEVVGEFVSLKKRGVNFIGLCPFHQEKTPSFTVTAAKGIYKCFGCGKGGNVVSFLMEHENYSYPEALRWLAQKYQIELEEDELAYSDEYIAEQKERESLLIVLDYARQYYNKFLLEDSEASHVGLSYLYERDIREDTIHKFSLGYCPNDGNAFYTSAVKAGYEEIYLEKAGLIKKSEKSGEYYDVFRGRIIFPIINLAGKTIGFGGRVLGKAVNTAKYINSPENAVYHKSDVLFGIYHAKKTAAQRGNCFLVEGYMDVIRLQQEGIQNVVASSGTSLTDGQIKQLRRFTDNVTLLYDGDPAGIKASLRSVDLLLAGGFNIKVVTIPNGEDPDSYCKMIGGEEFVNFLSRHAMDFISYKSQLLLGENPDPITTANVMREVAESIAKIPDSFKREVYIKECATIFGYPATIFNHEVNSYRKAEASKKTVQIPSKLPIEKITYVNEQPFTDEYIETDVVRVLMEFGNQMMDEGISVMHFILNDLKQNKLIFELPQVKETIDELYRNEEILIQNLEEYLIQNRNPRISGLAINILTHRYWVSEHWSNRYEVEIKPRSELIVQDVFSAINRLKIRKVDKLITEFNAELIKEKDTNKISEVLMVIMHLQQQRAELCKSTGTVVIK